MKAIKWQDEFDASLALLAQINQWWNSNANSIRRVVPADYPNLKTGYVCYCVDADENEIRGSARMYSVALKYLQPNPIRRMITLREEVRQLCGADKKWSYK